MHARVPGLMRTTGDGWSPTYRASPPSVCLSVYLCHYHGILSSVLPQASILTSKSLIFRHFYIYGIYTVLYTVRVTRTETEKRSE